MIKSTQPSTLSDAAHGYPPPTSCICPRPQLWSSPNNNSQPEQQLSEWFSHQSMDCCLLAWAGWLEPAQCVHARAGCDRPLFCFLQQICCGCCCSSHHPQLCLIICLAGAEQFDLLMMILPISIIPRGLMVIIDEARPNTTPPPPPPELLWFRDRPWSFFLPLLLLLLSSPPFHASPSFWS